LDVVPLADLERMHTGTLIARLKRLHWCMEDEAAANDYTAEEIANVADKIVFKSDVKWKQAYKEVKQVLSEREHSSRKP